MAAGSSDTLAGMMVEFGAEYTQLESAGTSIGAIFTRMEESAAQASAGISEEMTLAGESATSFGEMFQMASENMASALNMPIEQVMAVQTAAEEAAAGTSAALEGVTGPVDGLSTSFADLAAAAVEDTSTITSHLGEVAAAAQEAGSQVSTAAEEASGGGGGGGGLMSLVSSAGMAVFGLQSIIQVGGQLASSLLGPAQSAETVTSALTTMDGSAAKAGQEMQALNAFAAKTPFKTLDIDQAAMQLQGFGYSAHSVIPMITSIGDALGSVGRSTPAEMDSVIQIFGKMRGEGKVTTMMMNELAVHGIDGWKALSDATGKTIPQVQEMVKKGLLPANQAVDDLTKGIEMNPLYKGGMARSASTFTGLLSTLQSNWDQVIAAFGTPIIKALEGQLSNLGNMLSSPAFQQFAGSVGQGIVNIFGSIGKAVSPLLSDLAPVGGFIQNLGKDFQSLGKGGGNNSFLNSLASGFNQVKGIVGGTLSDDFKFFQGILTDLGKWWQSDMLPAIQQAMPGFEHLGSVIATTVAPAMAKLWSIGQQLFHDVIGPGVKGFEAMEPVLVRVGGFLADNLGKAIQFITPDIISAAQAIEKFAAGISERVEPIVQNLWTGISMLLKWIGPYWPQIWGMIEADFMGVWDRIKGAVQIGWSLISGLFNITLDIIGGKWGKAWDDMKGMFEGIWEGIQTFMKGVFEPIWGPIKMGINGVIDLLNNFIKGVDAIHISAPGIGTIGFNIPTIPHLATGGFVPPGGMAIAGDPGPNSELVFGGASGATVMSHAASMAMAGSSGGGGRQDVHVHVYLDSRELTNQIGMNILNMVRVGGPVGSVA